MTLGTDMKNMNGYIGQIRNVASISKSNHLVKIPWNTTIKSWQTSRCINYNYLTLVLIGSLVVLGLTALWDYIWIYIRPSSRERERKRKKYRREKILTDPPASTASTVGSCPTNIQTSFTPCHCKLHSTSAPSEPPQLLFETSQN